MNKRFVLLIGCVLAAPACAETVVVTAGHMIDVVAGKTVDAPQIVITDGRITAVGHRGDLCGKARVGSSWGNARSCRA